MFYLSILVAWATKSGIDISPLSFYIFNIRPLRVAGVKEFEMRANNDTPRRTGSKFNIDFWKYWTGQTISNLGSSITIFALPLLVYKLTGSALDLGIATAATFLPYLLFGLILGAWTDRVNRKRMMIGTDIGRALIVVSIPLLFALCLLTGWW